MLSVSLVSLFLYGIITFLNAYLLKKILLDDIADIVIRAKKEEYKEKELEASLKEKELQLENIKQEKKRAAGKKISLLALSLPYKENIYLSINAPLPPRTVFLPLEKDLIKKTIINLTEKIHHG